MSAAYKCPGISTLKLFNLFGSESRVQQTNGRKLRLIALIAPSKISIIATLI